MNAAIQAVIPVAIRAGGPALIHRAMRVRRRSRRPRFAAVFGAVALTLLVACGVGDPPRDAPEVTGGEADRGRSSFVDYGCSSCHTIPGVSGANALVAPPLTQWAERRFIAGRLANNPDNLIEWIMSPQDVDPQTAMPDMGVPEAIARDMAAYLYSLD